MRQHIQMGTSHLVPKFCFQRNSQTQELVSQQTYRMIVLGKLPNKRVSLRLRLLFFLGRCLRLWHKNVGIFWLLWRHWSRTKKLYKCMSLHVLGKQLSRVRIGCTHLQRKELHLCTQYQLWLRPFYRRPPKCPSRRCFQPSGSWTKQSIRWEGNSTKFLQTFFFLKPTNQPHGNAVTTRNLRRFRSVRQLWAAVSTCTCWQTKHSHSNTLKVQLFVW